MMRLALLLSLTVATAASGVADSGPSVISEAGVVRPGDRYVLQGDSWFVGPRCESRVQVSQRENHGVRVGSARVRDNGTFTFTRRVPRRARLGSRIVLDVTQLCDGTGTTRTVRLKVGKARRTCPGTASVDGVDYQVKVFGGLPCGRGAEAIGAFIDTDIEPAEWSCAHVDPELAGYEFECIETTRPGRRVTASRL